jgi:hypothetical protein
VGDVSENDICRERVARATTKTLTLGGAPSPFIEFRDSMPIGGIVVYELRYVTRSLSSILVEIGVAAYSAGNKLTRLSVIRSVKGRRKGVRIAGPSHGVFFVRAISADPMHDRATPFGEPKYHRSVTSRPNAAGVL